MFKQFDDIKCIIANGQMIINIEADQLYFTQLGSTGHSSYMLMALRSVM